MAYIIEHADNHRLHIVKLTEVIIVNLDESPTTGYIWEPQPNDKLTLTEDTYPPQKETQLAGGNRKHQFVFLPGERGSHSLVFNLCRPWDKDDRIDSLKFDIQVSD